MSISGVDVSPQPPATPAVTVNIFDPSIFLLVPQVPECMMTLTWSVKDKVDVAIVPVTYQSVITDLSTNGIITLENYHKPALIFNESKVFVSMTSEYFPDITSTHAVSLLFQKHHCEHFPITLNIGPFSPLIQLDHGIEDFDKPYGPFEVSTTLPEEMDLASKMLVGDMT